MDSEEFWREKPLNPTPYYCNICKVYCASAINLQTHFLGNKHKAVEEALKSHGIIKPLNASGEPVRTPESLPNYIQTEPEKGFIGKTLEEQLNSCKDSEPAIGLQYIIEYGTKDNPIYECHLCISKAGLTNMFMHVLGIKHRLAYLKKHHPGLANVTGRGSNLNRKLKELAAKVEQEEGRKPIRSTINLPISKDDVYSVDVSDSLVTWFSEDDAGVEKKTDPKPIENEMADKAEEASKDLEAEKAKCDDSSKSEDIKELEQNTVQQQNAELLESDSDSEEFTSNEGLLKYLKSFEIVDEDDAAFILKVTQKLTNALVTYREKVSERQNSYEVDPYGSSGDQSEKVTSVGTAESHDFSQWQLPVEQSFDGTGTDFSVKKSVKRKASEQNTKPSKDIKLGTFVSTFKELPNEQDSSDAEEPGATSCDAKKLDVSEQPDAASCTLEGQEAAQTQDAPSGDPEGQDGSCSLQNQSGGSAPSLSESHVIARFFSSIRNMDIDEVAATLKKIAESNPAFSGMDVQNVIKILTESGALKAKNSASTS